MCAMLLMQLFLFLATTQPTTRMMNLNHRTWLLAILWSARLVIDISSATSRHGDSIEKNVSVLMSTSIVESANYQPAEDNPSHENVSPASTIEQPDRLARSQQDDNSSPPSLSRSQILLPAAQPSNRPNQPSTGKILDLAPQPTAGGNGGGYRWSVSTSRALSPGSPIQVLQQQRPVLAQESNGNQRKLARRIQDSQTISDLRCEGRGIGRMLRSARHIFRDRISSIEDHSGLLMVGSSLLAATIPLTVLYSSGGSLGELMQPSNRRATGADTGAQSLLRQLSLQSRVESMMGWIERSVEHLPRFPRLHPQECVKRSICEAHNEPDKFGAIGFILRLLFPATNVSVTDRMDDMDYKVINKYRHAAGFGLNKRMESSRDNSSLHSASPCRDKYEDCLISLLEVARNMMDVFLR